MVESYNSCRRRKATISSEWYGWSRIHPKFRHEYIEITCQEFGRDLWHKSMFHNPCKCCGSNEHSLLKILDNEDIHIEFACPVIHHDKIEDMLKEDRKDNMYRPCPSRFANLYGYVEEDCAEALKLLDSLGAGKYWSWPIYRVFSEKVLEACVNYSRQCTFKRDQSLECHYVGELEFTEEEESSSATA